jgi:hypothetical protein
MVTKKDCVIVGMTTEHFSFIGLAKDERSATALIHKAWRKHMSLAEGEKVNNDGFDKYDVWMIPMDIGEVSRDHEIIYFGGAV